MRNFPFDPVGAYGLAVLVTIFAGTGPILFTSYSVPIH